jgi:hypothetical protein
MDDSAAPHDAPRSGPAGTQLYLGRHGPQLAGTHGARWSDEAETLFLDHLAATANVMASAEACGFTPQALYARRRKDAAFAQRWDSALAQGYAHIEALLVQRAIEALEGFEPDPATPIIIRDMTVKDAMILLGHHRRAVEGLPRSRRQKWRDGPLIEDARQNILRKVAALERAKAVKTQRAWAAALTGREQPDVPATRDLVRRFRGGPAGS